VGGGRGRGGGGGTTKNKIKIKKQTRKSAIPNKVQKEIQMY
jgi:hypothetical protein